MYFLSKTSQRLKTTCPAKSKRPDVGSGYKSLAETITQFDTHGQLPSAINLRILDEGDGVENTCSPHSACWHKQCLGQTLHTTTLQRLMKRTTTASETESCVDDVPEKIAHVTRNASGSVNVHFTSLCFFCETEGLDLRQVLTQKVDAKVRQCATVLEDNILLGKLAI